ncbi:plasmid partitioning protein RepB [Mameliella sediminis]|uniref:plasmid partitioning protein RepB n=1 Tax=Mameliella sediminis TaxID=2836866 RepID=UPI001CD2DD7C|nr:plasmid partitioning protein RepB [Mameliella sediminis]MCA0956843.1 plasmid partitioning protein RepB [Mameliella alba]
MARKIFTPPDAPSKDQADSPALSKRGSYTASVGGLRDSLREITANSIRDIDPDRIDHDGLRDRLAMDDDGIADLAESIRKHGQQVPILVRPSGAPDRYRIVYGRRRLAAIRQLGVPVKAIVRTLDDEASLIAQGQENNLRLDPSFIEKALFIRDMQAEGYKPQVIQDALGLSRQGISNHKVVLDQLPEEVIRLIGPAHGVGRRQWSDLASALPAEQLVEVTHIALSALPEATPSDEKFLTALAAAKKQKDKPAPSSVTDVHRGGHSLITDHDGRQIAELVRKRGTIGIQVSTKTTPEFSQWLEDHASEVMRDLYSRWQNGTDRAD